MDYESKLKELADHRAQAAKYKKFLAGLLAEVKNTEVYGRYDQEFHTHEEEAEALEAELREMAVLDFDLTHDKHPHPAVSIKVMTRLQYDPERAAGFCREYLPSAIKVDYKTFEKYAKNVADTAPLDFVEFVEEPQAQIVTDLSKFVK
jgi:hypothetical protein